MGLFSNTANVSAQASDPGPLGPGAIWSDTNAESIKRRNDANTDWVDITLNPSITTLQMGGFGISQISQLTITNISELTLDTNGDLPALTQLHHIIDTFADASTDSMEGFIVGPGNVILILQSISASRDPTIVDGGSGTVACKLAGNFTMDTLDDRLLMRGSAELSRSNNA